MTHIQYIRKLLVACSATLLLALTTNYIIDPAHLFDTKRSYEAGIAQLLAEGWNVANISNYDERITQQIFVDQLTEPRDIIVFGSSRSMQLRSHLFPGQRFFNNAVTGASLEDHMAIYEMYHRRKLLPKTVILGLDPWLLNANNGQTRWNTIADHLVSIAHRLGVEAPFQNQNSAMRAANRYLQLISIDYFEESLRQLIRIIKHQKIEHYPTHAEFTPEIMKRADGSLVYGENTRNRPSREVRIRADANARRGAIYGLGAFEKLDSRAMRALEIWVNSMQKAGVRVVFFIPPYHPTTYQVLRETGRAQILTGPEDYYRRLASERGIEIIGSMDGAAVGCSEAEFTDDMHPTDSCVNRLFTKFTP